MLCVFMLFVAALLSGCKDQEKEQLKQDVANLQTSVADRQETILKMSTESLNRRDSLLASQAKNDSLTKSLTEAHKQLASANAMNKKQKKVIDSLEFLAGDSLRCVEQANAILLEQRHEFELATVELGKEIAHWKNRAAADSAKADTMRICYDVAAHNAYYRSWFQYRLGTGFWGLPFTTPAWLDKPVVTSNPAAKPQSAEKKSRRHK